MEQFIQCNEFCFDDGGIATGEITESVINMRYVVSARPRTLRTPNNGKEFAAYSLTMSDKDIRVVKREPHLISVFGV